MCRDTRTVLNILSRPVRVNVHTLPCRNLLKFKIVRHSWPLQTCSDPSFAMIWNEDFGHKQNPPGVTCFHWGGTVHKEYMNVGMPGKFTPGIQFSWCNSEAEIEQVLLGGFN